MDPNSTRCFASILAGGAGTRFWPASRRQNPKPFLDLFGAGPLVSLTRDRLVPVVGEDNVLFVLGAGLLPRLEAVLPGSQAVGEPIPRNTLGAVLISLGYVLAKDENARLAILPADHMIGQLDRYRRTMVDAFALAENRVVTIGVTPTYPETGYGYIHQGDPLEGGPAFHVRRFTEKPGLEDAQRFVDSGEFVWNAGMFVMPARWFTETARTIDPYYGEVVDQIKAALTRGELAADLLQGLLEPLPNTNIDKAVIEQCDELVMIPAQFPWSDVGTWDAVFDQRPADAANLEVGDVLVSGGSGNVVVSAPDGPLVAVRGVKDLVVVATEDAVLVTRRGLGQEVGEVVKELRSATRDELL